MNNFVFAVQDGISAGETFAQSLREELANSAFRAAGALGELVGIDLGRLDLGRLGGIDLDPL
ncbi:MAG: hypothetical protein R2867_05265 [Caldilineaceae bacterium]